MSPGLTVWNVIEWRDLKGAVILPFGTRGTTTVMTYTAAQPSVRVKWDNGAILWVPPSTVVVDIEDLVTVVLLA